MRVLGIEFRNRADRKILRIDATVADIYDDGPVDREWVEGIVNTIEETEFTDKVASLAYAIMDIMLWRASCNGFNDIIERISSKYKENLAGVGNIFGQCFWCAAIKGNVEGMKILVSHFDADIKDKHFSEALNRASLLGKSSVIDYLFESHGHRLNADAVNNALGEAAITASINNIDKLFAARGHQITKAGIDNALREIAHQRQYGEDGYDFTSADLLLRSKKEQLFGTSDKPAPGDFTI